MYTYYKQTYINWKSIIVGSRLHVLQRSSYKRKIYFGGFNLINNWFMSQSQRKYKRKENLTLLSKTNKNLIFCFNLTKNNAFLLNFLYYVRYCNYLANKTFDQLTFKNLDQKNLNKLMVYPRTLFLNKITSYWVKDKLFYTQCLLKEERKKDQFAIYMNLIKNSHCLITTKKVKAFAVISCKLFTNDLLLFGILQQDSFNKFIKSNLILNIYTKFSQQYLTDITSAKYLIIRHDEKKFYHTSFQFLLFS